MSWWSRPEAKVVPWINELSETLLCFEHVVQDLVELPFSKAGIQNTLPELCIPVQSMLLIGILDLSLES